jgi:hypothetical protein
MSAGPHAKGPRGYGPFIYYWEGVKALTLVLALIKGLSLLEVCVRAFHEVGLGVLAAEAVGATLYRRVDGAICLHVLVVGEAPRTHVVELASHRIGRTGKADEEYAG